MLGAMRGVLLFLVVAAVLQGAEDYFVYFGTYTAKTSKGIHAYRFQPDSGKLTALGTVAEAPNPSFLAVSPDRKFLYAVNWRGSDTTPGNTVSAYALDDRTGKLTFLNKSSSRGLAPTHLALDQTGRMLIAVNYDSGGVTSYQVAKNGTLSEPVSFDQHEGSSVVKGRQDGPHAHAVVFSPDNRFALVADLGLDKIFTYPVNPAKGTFDPAAFVKTTPGEGPRHLAFHPNRKFVYANNELNSTVTAYAYHEAFGNLSEIQTITTLPANFKESSATAEIQIDHAGKYLYVSNRGHDSIASFAIDAAAGTLTTIEHVSTMGKTPRNFSLDPTGTYLFAANENSDTVVVLRVQPGTGRLRATGQVLGIPSPSCVLFVRAR
jgi:6-phosphogluconolactonase